VPTFTGLEEMAAEGCLVKPLLHQFLMDSNSGASINVIVERPARRKPDGWFHASQHPLAGERELYLWATGQLGGEEEEFSYQARCAVMFGSLFHGVFEAFLDWTGFAEPLPEGDCPNCGRPYRALRARPSARYCTEHGFRSEETRSSCHLDGILNFSGDRHGLDIKTIYPFGLKGVKDMDLKAFRDKWPKYWAQGQECMRLSGLRQYIFMFVTMGSPWDTREFHVPFDPAFAVATELKYKRVLSHAERGVAIVA
jgi:hypothetical protein